MGDVPTGRQSQPSGAFRQDNSPNSTTNPNNQQAHPQNMDVEQHPQQHFAMSNYAAPTSMDMRSLVGALPSHHQPFQQQYHPQAASHQPSMYQFQQGQQFAGQTANVYNQNLAQQYQQQYAQSQQRQHQAAYSPVQSLPHGYHNQGFQMTQGLPVGGHQYLQPPTGQYGPAYGTRVGGYPAAQLRVNAAPGSALYPQPTQPIRRSSSDPSFQASVLRGPPRKPKQSGHALWVGNLPPGTHIIDLKDHFSRDATADIESVFLISKSNCAFVNYNTETSCASAMARFHDSRFNGVRLVCRLRRGSGSGPGTPQSATITPQSPTVISPDAQVDGGSSQQALPAEESAVLDSEPTEMVKEKFFVVKSLTVEDLERSVASGVWATQAHNEEALNKAYQTAENVYLIFSANKSGEYFGYARMDSPIDSEASATLELPVRPEASPEASMLDLPLTIHTSATATAPKGRVIDDSARGTIFWEADNEEKDEEETGNLSGEEYESGISGRGTSPATPQTFGKPFKVVWVSTERLPFYRTRGLRNPWNSNREVKIARDGTEIEPSVGRRLISMFHKSHVASASPGGNRQSGPMMPMQQGYVPPPVQMQGNPYGRPF